jgi:stage II sporulation protein GA (sporulation sigma-E factor processing peptidase)
MEYEWYVDVYFLSNVLMDLTGILVAAICCNRNVRFWRSVVVSAASVLASIFLMLNVSDYLLIQLIVHSLLNPLMILLIFHPKDIRSFLRLWATVYVVFLLVGGMQECIQLQRDAQFEYGVLQQSDEIFGYGILLQAGRDTCEILISGILAGVAFCVYMLRQRTMRNVCVVDLWMGEEKITVNAYCDSGNLLRDPKSGNPVSILEQNMLNKWGMHNFEIRKIPCHTISESQTYLDVITLDQMDIYLKGTVIQIKAPDIGLHTGKLMQHPDVQMLLHASYMNG